MPSMPPFLLVTTSDRYDFEWERNRLSSIPDVSFELRNGTPVTEDELIELGRDADALLISSRDPISRRVIEQLTACKVISRYAVGLDHIDLDAATEHGIVVTHFPDYCTNEVADHAMALILALNRRIIQLDRDLRHGAWTDHAHHMDHLLRGPIAALRDCTLGLVGLGRIGKAVAERARPFGICILAHDPFIDERQFAESGASSRSLSELLGESDMVSIHAPLTPGTQGLIDATAISAMRPGSLLVNTARGPIVDLPAAIEALQRGHLGGAAFDVVDPEPLPIESPLYSLDNVILTPHSAYYSERSVETVRTETLDAAIDVLRGRLPRIVANPEVLTRVTLRART